jgi:hypothetical protein
VVLDGDARGGRRDTAMSIVRPSPSQPS